ncbi:MAG TPA: TadE/TadG family type IV pilus assembly protein [Terracidiphilus sp.]|nr:TadE/TadG family type IV pilus assembly protein [Terracidiphilus sp.]
MKIRNLIRSLRKETGSEMVEFALASMIFFSTILGIADLSRAMYVYHFVTYASQQATRYAIVRGASWSSACSTSAPPSFSMSYQCTASSADIQNFVKSLGTVNSANLTITPTWPGTTADCSSSCSACTTTNAAGCLVQVKVSYAFTFLTPFFKHTSVNFYGTAEKTIQE